MTSELEKLDPNVVITLTYSKENLARLLAEFSVRGIRVLTRPASGTRTLYCFLKLPLDERSFDDLYDISQNLSFINSVTPLYTTETKKRLDELVFKMEAKEFIRTPTERDLSELAQLTGNIEQSLYFAFITEYIKSMGKFSLIGLLVRVAPIIHSYEFNYLYTILLLVWTLYFTAIWVYAKEPYYKVKFSTVEELSSKTAAMRKYKATHNPPGMNLFLKKVSFMPITCLFAASIVVLQVFCFGLDIYLKQLSLGLLGPVYSMLPTLLLVVSTPLITALYDRYFVRKYLSFEDGPSSQQSRTEKLFILKFLTSYLPLLITMFLYMPFGFRFSQEWKTGVRGLVSKFSIIGHDKVLLIDTTRYKQQIFYFTVNAQLISILLENILPVLLDALSRWQRKKNKSNSPGTFVEETVREEYPLEWKMWKQVEDYQNGHWGVFDANEAFQGLVIQFGYVAMFSTIWPLMPPIYCGFNFVVLKLSLWRAIKRCTPSTLPYLEDSSVRKEPNEVKNPEISESWNIILQFITLLGSVVSPILTLMYADSTLPAISHPGQPRDGTVLLLQSPVKHSFFTVLVSAIVFEHMSALLYFMIARVQTYSTSYSNHYLVSDHARNVATELPRKIDLFPVALEGNRIMDKIRMKYQQNIAVRKESSITKGQSQSREKELKDHPAQTREDFSSYTETKIVRNDNSGRRTAMDVNDSRQTIKSDENSNKQFANDYGYMQKKGHQTHPSIPLPSFNTTPSIKVQGDTIQNHEQSAEEDVSTIETNQLYDQGESDTAGATLPSCIYVSEANAPRNVSGNTTDDYSQQQQQQESSHSEKRGNNTDYNSNGNGVGYEKLDDKYPTDFPTSEAAGNPETVTTKTQTHLWTTLRDNHPKEVRRAARLKSKSQGFSTNLAPLAAAAATSALYGEQVNGHDPSMLEKNGTDHSTMYKAGPVSRAPRGATSTTNENTWIRSTLRHQPGQTWLNESNELRAPPANIMKTKGEEKIGQNYTLFNHNNHFNDDIEDDEVEPNGPSEFTGQQKENFTSTEKNAPFKSGIAHSIDEPSKRKTFFRRVKEIF